MAGPGSDLEVPPGPGLPEGLTIPAADLLERFSRSPGPGGQSVNTSDTRVELVYDVGSSAALTDDQRARLLSRLAGSLVNETIVLAPPPPSRRPTRPTKGSQRRRLDEKRQRGETKSLRGRVRDQNS
jgi:ribosome-associated protein